MGEAKRRGTFEQRVASALEKSQMTMSTRAMRSQIELQEHMQRLEARRAQIEMHMGPMDKLHAQQSQVLRQAADKLKQMEGVQIVAETNEAVVVTIASPESLGTVIEHEAITPSELTTETNNLNVASQGGFRVGEMAVIVTNSAPELTSQIDNSHFDDLSPIVHESKS